MKDFEQMLRSMIEKKSNEKVVKTIPMKKEWLTRWEKVLETRELIEKNKRELESRERMFWAKVEEDTQIFENMRVRFNRQEIEVIED